MSARRGLALLAGALVCGGSAGEARVAAVNCAPQTAGAAYSRGVTNALRSGRDVWGAQLIASPDGPTYEGVRRYLHPLFLARAAHGTKLTDSDVHYVPFAMPTTTAGAGSVALHVADGSQVVSERAHGRRMTLGVGASGRERYGSCRARLAEPRLLDGHLPVLETEYVDGAGRRYTQESFAARIPETRFVVSFVRVTAEPGSAAAAIRFAHSGSRLRAGNGRLARGSAVHMVFASGGRYDGRAVSYAVPPGAGRTVYVAWVNYPRRAAPFVLDAARHERARRSVVSYWNRRLAEAAPIELPDERVEDGLRALLAQNLNHAWRYSIGNQYEQFSFPEGPDVAEVMGGWGYAALHASIMRVSLTRKREPYANWKMGTKLVGAARHYELYRQRAFVARATPALAGYVEFLSRQVARDPRGLLARERFSSDIPDQVYGLHSQAVVWQGLLAISRVWSATGNRALAARARGLAFRLERGLRRAVGASQRRLPDGSLFLPARLLDGERPYASVTESRQGSYWNLVIPYALASGLFTPGSAEARGALRYFQLHGTRFLGLVRAGAFSLYGRQRRFPTGGTDQVYGVNQSQFLADLDQPDELVLSLYGHLGAGMAPGTYVSGEGATLQPLRGAFHRTMYLPPNGASNAAFLETLRLMLVHERRDRNGAPVALRLANATARPWLRPGRRIAVRRLPTAFGPVSYTLESSSASVRATVDVPTRRRPPRLALRVRLPRGARVTSATVDGRTVPFDRAAETVDLSGRTGRVEVTVAYDAG